MHAVPLLFQSFRSLSALTRPQTGMTSLPDALHSAPTGRACSRRRVLSAAGAALLLFPIHAIFSWAYSSMKDGASQSFFFRFSTSQFWMKYSTPE